MSTSPSESSFLIVDESHNELSIMSGALRAIGAETVHRTADMFGALEILKSNEIDIAFINNPKGAESGFELVRMIRSAKDLPSRGLNIVMTSYACDAATITTAIRSGADGFLRKPLSVKMVDQQVRVILTHPIPRVEFGDYFGPDRRRRVDPNFAGTDRREDACVLL